MDGGRHGWVSLSYFFLGAFLGLVVTTISGVVLMGALVAGGGGDVAGAAVLSALVGGVVLYTHLIAGLNRSKSQSTTEAPAPPGTAPSTPTSTTAPLWPSSVYFRVAALVGLIVAVAGAIGVCDAIASQVFGAEVPDAFSEFPGGFPEPNNNKDLLQGILTVGVGLLVMWWHLTEARKRGQ